MTNLTFIQPGMFSDTELPMAASIQRKRLQLLVHSYLYYELDESIISDKQFDDWAKELVELQAKYPHIAERICYHEAFKDWQGSTGAFLPYKDAWVIQKAHYLLSIRGENFKDEHKKILQSTGKPSSQSTERQTPSKQRSNKVPQGRRSLF